MKKPMKLYFSNMISTWGARNDIMKMAIYPSRKTTEVVKKKELRKETIKGEKNKLPSSHDSWKDSEAGPSVKSYTPWGLSARNGKKSSPFHPEAAKWNIQIRDRYGD